MQGVLDRRVSATRDECSIEAMAGGAYDWRNGPVRGWPDRYCASYGGIIPCGVAAEGGIISFYTEVFESEQSLWKGDVSVAYTVVEHVDEVIRPVRSDEIDSLFADALSSRLLVLCDGRCLFVEPPPCQALANVTVGLEILILHDNIEVGRTETLWRYDAVGVAPMPEEDTLFGRSPGDAGEGAPYSVLCPVRGDTDRMVSADLSDPAWTIRLRGSGHLALRDFDGTHYWSGHVEMPAAVLERGQVTEPDRQ